MYYYLYNKSKHAHASKAKQIMVQKAQLKHCPSMTPPQQSLGAVPEKEKESAQLPTASQEGGES